MYLSLIRFSSNIVDQSLFRRRHLPPSVDQRDTPFADLIIGPGLYVHHAPLPVYECTAKSLP